MEDAHDDGLVPLPPPPSRVEVIPAGGQVLVRLRGAQFMIYEAGDAGAMHCAAVALTEVDGVTVQEVAEAFGISREHLSRLRSSYRDQGMVGIVDRRGPKGKSKLTEARCRRIRRLKAKGLTHQEIARKVGVSVASVSRALSTPLREVPEQLLLTADGGEAAGVQEPALAAAALVSGESPVAELESPEPSDSSSEGRVEPVAEVIPDQSTSGPQADEAPAAQEEPPSASSRPTQELPEEPVPVQFAGAMLLHEPLRLLGLVESFEAAGARLGPARSFDLQEVLGTLALGFGVGLANVEQFKLAVRVDLGLVAGIPWAPEVRTLRRKLVELSGSADAVLVMRELARTNLRLEPAWEALYYVDGHFIPYYGNLAVPKSRDPRSTRKVKGRTDTHVHDVNGRPLFYVSSPTNRQLVSLIPEVLEELLEVVGENADVILMFDRGGWSPDLFGELDDQNVGFAIFMKGSPKDYAAPADSEFEPRWYEFEGKRYTYSIAETELALGDRLYRVIVFRDGDGNKVAIVTNMWHEPAAKVVHLLKLRWRQENNLKDLTHNKWLDGIVEYGGDAEPDSTLIPHPKRAELKARLAEVIQERTEVEAKLGRAARDNPETTRPTMRGFKISHAELTRRSRELQVEQDQLEAEIAKLPAQVRRCDLDESSLRVILRTQRRNLINAIKVTVNNAERWLARRFLAYFADPDEYRITLRNLLRQPGELHYRQDAGEVLVRLRAPDSPKMCRALEALLGELDNRRPRTLDGRWAIRYELM
jgi:transcriptional regulator with XRE-family HTH domain